MRLSKILFSLPKPQSGDVVAGISVALLALPQGLAYAELAGMPAKYGLYAAAIPSLLAAIFASSPYLQTGPVALTALLAYGALESLEDPFTEGFVELAALLALLVGGIRFLLGVFRLGKIADLLTDAVILGFTNGAAILIVFSQLPKSLGVQNSDNGILRSGWDAITTPGLWQFGAITFSVLTILIVLGGRLFNRLFPGVLVAVVFGIIISHLIDYSGPVVGELSGGFVSLKFNFDWTSFGDLLLPSAIIAVVGFAEPTAIARTFSKQDGSNWSPSKEFISQGIANMASAFSSSFPVGGSFGRSSLNKIAGAKTPWSGAITGAVVLGLLPLSSLLSELPSAILGATVIWAVMKLIKPLEFFDLVRNEPEQALIAMGTLFATLVTAPRIDRGIVLGVLLSFIAYLLKKFQVKRARNENGPPVSR